MLADTIKGKICRWIIGNYFEAMFRVIVNRYAELKNLNVSKESFVAHHDSLMNEFEKSDGNLTIQSLAKIGKITYGGPLFGSKEYAKLINARHKKWCK